MEGKWFDGALIAKNKNNNWRDKIGQNMSNNLKNNYFIPIY